MGHPRTGTGSQRRDTRHPAAFGTRKTAASKKAASKPLAKAKGSGSKRPAPRVRLPHNTHVTSTQPRPTSLRQLGQGQRRLGGRGKEPEPEPREDSPLHCWDWVLKTFFLLISYTNCHTAQNLGGTANKHWSRARHAGSCSRWRWAPSVRRRSFRCGPLQQLVPGHGVTVSQRFGAHRTSPEGDEDFPWLGFSCPGWAPRGSVVHFWPLSFSSPLVAPAWVWRGLALGRHRAATSSDPVSVSRGRSASSLDFAVAHAPSPPLSLLCRDGRFLAPGGRWPRPSPRKGYRSAPLRKWSPSWRRRRRASQRVWGRGALGPRPEESSNSGPCGSQAALCWRRSPAAPVGRR